MTQWKHFLPKIDNRPFIRCVIFFATSQKKKNSKNITKDTKGLEIQEKTRKYLPLFKTILIKVCKGRTLKFGLIAPKRTKWGVDLRKCSKNEWKKLKKRFFSKSWWCTPFGRKSKILIFGNIVRPYVFWIICFLNHPSWSQKYMSPVSTKFRSKVMMLQS